MQTKKMCGEGVMNQSNSEPLRSLGYISSLVSKWFIYSFDCLRSLCSLMGQTSVHPSFFGSVKVLRAKHRIRLSYILALKQSC